MFSRRVVWAVLIISAASALLFVLISAQVGNDIRETLVSRATDRAEAELRARLNELFVPVEQNLAVTSRWGERGLLDLADHQLLNTLFVPILEQSPRVASMLIANEAGDEYLLLRGNTGWVTRASDAERTPGTVTWRHWADIDSLLEQWDEPSDYDPHERPWYRNAVGQGDRARDGIFWTSPYRFFTTGELGITLSRPFRVPPPDGALHVAGFDVTVSDMLDLAGHGIVDRRGARPLLLTEDGRVYDAASTDVDRPATRKPNRFEGDLVSAWTSAGNVIDGPFEFTNATQRWMGDVRYVTRDSTSPYLAIALPGATFDPEVATRKKRYSLIIVALFVVGAIVNLTLTKLMAPDASRNGVRAPETAAELQELIRKGESDRLEFKETLRWNVRTDKPGKEVEVSWLKTLVAYMNTEGGVLLVGVDDDGQVTGIEADQFTSEDKYLLHFNNLLKEHIGLEFAQYVSANLQKVADRKILVVRCGSSPDPVFLKHGKDESYYVRVGPSSRQLAMSEVVKRHGR
jgi:hypothetical protein